MIRKLWIQGSCVSRDPVEFDKETLRVSRFRARSSIISLVSPPVGMIDHDEGTTARFEVLNALADFSKSWLTELPKADETAIFDFIDERFGVIDTGKGYVTLSTSLLAIAEREKILAMGAFISPYSQAYYDLVSANLDAFCEHLSDIQNLCVHSSYWAEERPDGPVFPETLRRLVAPQNRMLDIIYDKMAAKTKARFFGAPKGEYVAAAEHKWGLAPFHYTEETVRSVLRSLRSAVGLPTALPDFE